MKNTYCNQNDCCNNKPRFITGCLYKSRKTGWIVLCTQDSSYGEFSGVVVHSSEIWRVGECRIDWNYSGVFEEFHGSVTLEN